MSVCRILFLADTHLGFDTPLHPRIDRRRRGDDFFLNYRRVLDTARREGIDFVIHGGDLFAHSKISGAIVVRAFEPLLELAEDGIPVFIVPGNHERSKIPQTLFSIHDNLHIFSKPTTYYLTAGDLSVSLSGFPYVRNIRDRYADIASALAAGVSGSPDVRILCMHHIVEGARIGVFDYVFRHGDEVIRGRDITGNFDMILSGHIHRYQILTQDLSGKPLDAHIYYPGSIERSSFAERNEVKGFLILELQIDGETGRPVLGHQFIPLPARPMVSFDISASTLTVENLEERIGGLLKGLDVNSVVRIAVRGDLDDNVGKVMTAGYLRSLAPDTMNVTLVIPGKRARVDGTL